MSEDQKIAFAKHHSSFVVGILDIVGSTAALEQLEGASLDDFYTVFLSEVTETATQGGAVVLKNIGDGILFYFPDTTGKDPERFMHALACGKNLLADRERLNERLAAQGLAPVSYRISMSYGPVSAMLDERGNPIDLFGAVVSTCAKMNKLARPDTLIVGEALHASLLPLAIESEQVATLTISRGHSFAVYEIK